MKKGFVNIIALLGVALLFGACTNNDEIKQDLLAWNDASNTKLVFMGEATTTAPWWRAPVPVNDLLMNSTGLENMLRAYGSTSTATNLGQLINGIEDQNAQSRDVPAMSGLGGMYGHALLSNSPGVGASNPGAARLTLLTTGDFDGSAKVGVFMSGQITQFEFIRNSTNPTVGNGTLEVVTNILAVKASNGVGAGPLPHAPGNTVSFRWTLAVVNNGYSVVEKGTTSDYFPGTLNFSQAMKDRIDQKKFTHKLWAHGTDIRIRNVEIRRGAIWRPINRTPTPPYAKYATLYDEIPDNCIDMLFVGQPPRFLNNLTEPPIYCLGRCAHPLIINTGL
ncbi:MAG: hypothetical protein ISR50_12810 [Alphaproteobacteria bacterium]|nr:hypothetical protein [Alphaproteobacteria bacterium]MBL6953510.1 hypothetical protein [Alphaproteobacteria bacterium]